MSIDISLSQLMKLRFFEKPKTRDFSSFFRIFQSYIESGNGISEALSYLRTRNPTLQKSINNIRENVDDGMQLGDAFEKENDVLPKYAISVIKAGSQSNRLKEALINIGEYLKYERRFERKIYATVKEVRMNVAILLLMGLFIIKWYIPSMQNSLKAVDPNSSIQNVVNLFLFLNDYYYILLISSVSLILLLYKFHKSFPYWGDWLLFKVPIYKEVYYYKIQYRFTTTMSMLLNIGLSNTEILYNMSKSINNTLISNMLNRAIQYNQDGMTLIEAIKKADEQENLIEQTTIFHLQSGEKNLDMKNQLIHASSLYIDNMQEAVEDYSKNISNISVAVGALFAGLCWLVVYGPYLEVGKSYLNIITK